MRKYGKLTPWFHDPRIAAGNRKPPVSELEYFQSISFINSIAASDSRAGACGGGFDPEMLGFAFPSPAGAAGSRPLRERGNAPRARTHRVGGTPFLPAHQVGGTPLVPAGAARAARSKGEGGDTQLGGTGGDRGTVPAPGPAGAKSSGSQLANRSWHGSSRGGGSPATASQAASLQTHVYLQRARRL